MFETTRDNHSYFFIRAETTLIFVSLLSLFLVSCGRDEGDGRQVNGTFASKENSSKENVNSQANSVVSEYTEGEELYLNFICYKNWESAEVLVNTLVHCSFWDEEGQPVLLASVSNLLILKLEAIESDIPEESTSSLQWDLWFQGAVDMDNLRIIPQVWRVPGNIYIDVESEIQEMNGDVADLVFAYFDEYQDYDQSLFLEE